MKAVFLDRDGVINKDTNYVHLPKDFVFLSGVFEALKAYQDMGFLLFVVTNQSGIARGFYTEQMFLELTDFMQKEFLKRGIKISKTAYCPHAPNTCDCRKPSAKMILDLRKEFSLDLSKSWLIGDKETDIECAKNAKVHKTIILKTGHKVDERATKADFICENILDTIKILKGQN